ncbi:glucose-6-phosphate isomerase, putative [Theileria equi strain WA]|uniref:Glucose-6-phosphate isomerase n=1 Tax=Theileria equi strain WA TaxID=1537102 RepID=L1LCC7_THEEQ|nr:glucose-6-phosphate isomerase, putative [Theileria equi strain WA]EKX72905.1 glucose-6-phosphate isomerase, putative [Theileria equi strain WA]|eukprot:XP_004832357.1 glucose-6-phosphate isomerase, putative [Theileria equi strain WA]
MDCQFVEESAGFKNLLKSHSDNKEPNLGVLLSDKTRCNALIKQFDGITLDVSRQLLTLETMDKLLALAKEMKVKEKTKFLFDGTILNTSERRSVLHTALRLPKGSSLVVNGEDVLPGVHEVLDRIKSFSDDVRSGKVTASDGKPFDSILCVGIGGSFLGTAFTSEAFMGYEHARRAAFGKKIRFLSNVDPAGFRIVADELDPNRTLVIIISKTFTTVETIKNAITVKQWLLDNIANPKDFCKHLCAISTNLKLTKEFGIEDSRVFGFWDWVGGRYSVSSAVGVLPLSIYFGFDIVEGFLKGCHSMDKHFLESELEENLPVLMALCSFYNSAILGFNTVAILPYSQDLSKFAPYIQQLIMESNGKSVRSNGDPLPLGASEIYFGEPGTNGQHSFYQLFHQGRTVPSEFIGFVKSDNKDNAVNGTTHHQELMANFFAQPDALAYGLSMETLLSDGVGEEIARHKVCPGNRPSQVLLFDELTPYTVGQLVALYEHRTAVCGFLLGINSFDQMGVELGKILASDIRKLFASGTRNWSEHEKPGKLSYSTTKLLEKFTR